MSPPKIPPAPTGQNYGTHPFLSEGDSATGIDISNPFGAVDTSDETGLASAARTWGSAAPVGTAPDETRQTPTLQSANPIELLAAAFLNDPTLSAQNRSELLFALLAMMQVPPSGSTAAAPPAAVRYARADTGGAAAPTGTGRRPATAPAAPARTPSDVAAREAEAASRLAAIKSLATAAVSTPARTNEVVEALLSWQQDAFQAGETRLAREIGGLARALNNPATALATLNEIIALPDPKDRDDGRGQSRAAAPTPAARPTRDAGRSAGRPAASTGTAGRPAETAPRPPVSPTARVSPEAAARAEALRQQFTADASATPESPATESVAPAKPKTTADRVNEATLASEKIRLTLNELKSLADDGSLKVNSEALRSAISRLQATGAESPANWPMDRVVKETTQALLVAETTRALNTEYQKNLKRLDALDKHLANPATTSSVGGRELGEHRKTCAELKRGTKTGLFGAGYQTRMQVTFGGALGGAPAPSAFIAEPAFNEKQLQEFSARLTKMETSLAGSLREITDANALYQTSLLPRVQKMPEVVKTVVALAQPRDVSLQTSADALKTKGTQSPTWEQLGVTEAALNEALRKVTDANAACTGDSIAADRVNKLATQVDAFEKVLEPVSPSATAYATQVFQSIDKNLQAAEPRLSRLLQATPANDPTGIFALRQLLRQSQTAFGKLQLTSEKVLAATRANEAKSAVAALTKRLADGEKIGPKDSAAISAWVTDIRAKVNEVRLLLQTTPSTT